jgi:glycosyltransferase involved in cell wall biosynthesis
MSSSDFFVFPSRYEACTLAVIEALSSGLPVITTYQSGVSELVEPADGRKAGMVLADPENVRELEEAMQLLTSKPDVRAAMGAAARFAAERLGWETVASNYIQLFEAGKKPKEKELRVMGFATQGSSGDDENRLRALLSQLPSEIIPFDRRNKFKNSWNIFRIMSREKPGMMVMEGTGIAGGMALLAGNLVAGVPYVVSSGDAVGPFVSSQYPLLGPIFSWYEKLLYKRASGFIGWTPYLAGRALTYGAKFGMTAAGWAPFPYGDDELRQSRHLIRERYGIPTHHIVIGIVGSLHWNKRVGYCYGYELVKSILRIKRTDITVMIVGEGSGKEHLEKLAEGKPNIVFTGRVPREEVPAYLAAMDLASLPQSVDRVGSFRYTTKVSEYASVGLPIVTGKIPMSYDLNTGWMFRLNGWTPWDELYISSLSSLLEGITWEDIQLKRDNVPRDSPEFDKDNQVRSVKEFIWDIWYEVSIRK